MSRRVYFCKPLQLEIASFLGCSLRTVAYWCIHGDPENLESLKDERRSGNYHKATEEYIDLLLKTIDQKPSELGDKFGRWTAKRLATYLENQTGIKLSSSQVRRILAKKNTFTFGQNKEYLAHCLFIHLSNN